MRYLSVCSGIEAATVAWHPLGWEPAAFAEIDAFPSAVLAHHYPAVSNAGDFTELADVGPVDLLVGGTPCQDFSVAGLRAGMDGDRGNLTLEFLRLADRVRPRWVVWENVPGVLSIDGGRAFGAVLGGLAELGYGWAYRVLDAQYFGVPQRRRRVFVVGCIGDERRAAAVLFERASLSGHPTPRRQAGSIASALTRDGLGGGGVDDNIAQANHTVAATLRASSGRHGPPRDGADGIVFDPMQCTAPTYRGQPKPLSEAAHTMHSGGPPAIAFGWNKSVSQSMTPREVTDPLRASKSSEPAMQSGSAVRRLTPRECERLQGFPDDYTAVPYRKKPAADGPRYRALGNSMAVPVMRWIGERIESVA